MTGKTIRILCLAAIAAWLGAAAPASAQGGADAAEISFWETARDSKDPDMLRAYLDAYQNGQFRPLAEILLKKIDEAKTEQATTAVTTCDRLAGHPMDDQATASGSSFEDLKERAEEAIKACTEAAQSGAPRQIFQLGRAYLAAGEEKLAMMNYKKASDAGYRRAAYWYAQYLAEGQHGLTADGPAAVALHEKNAEAGDAESAFQAGWLLLIGKNGAAKDFARALKDLRKAEEMGSKNVHYPLGYMYEHGRGVERDIEEAKSRYRASVEKKSFYWPTARKRLVDLLEKQLKDKTYSLQSVANSEKLFIELLTHYRQRRGGKAEDYTDYVTRIGSLVDHAASVLNVAIVWRDSDMESMSPAYRPQVVAHRNAMVDLFFAALAERREAFPDSFAKQTDEYLASNRKELIARMTKAEKELITYREEASYANKEVDGKRANAPDKCLRADGKWRGDDYKVVLENNCKYDVKIEIEYGVRYRSGGYSDKEYNKTATIKAGDDRTFTVSTRNAKRSGHYFYRTCYAVQGFPEDADEPGTYKCPTPKRWADVESLDANFKAIPALLKELAEGTA